MLLPLLLVLSLALWRPAPADMLFRCPPCSRERLDACPTASVRGPCAELVQEPGCGCCRVCARLEGEACGVYTARCATGLRCYPSPDSELPLQALVQGQGACGQRRDGDYGTSQEPAAEKLEDHSDGVLVENQVDGETGTAVGVALGRELPTRGSGKVAAINRERANEQHRQMIKIDKRPHNPDDPKKIRPSARTLCQKNLDQVLERISNMHHPGEDILEHLYSLHIPNCDKNGLFNLKQCKMSLNGQRGECWCVNPNTGKTILGAPTIRGDPECHLYYNEQEERGAPTAHAP
ncbi:insulin-like growth factor-binding protein 2 [Microcaecilia unicolor]|uniref:Insulin-like growth factor-binding protein 2 n=1 Tax=Microcaecilia unicolor TaxID=1415580 RepID=A0A6P7YTD1_9AMPH|nr:insulin-like growth factor-binding protein 2 [Microcaecilia unicolor]